MNLCLEIFTALATWGPALDGTALLGLQSHCGGKTFKFQVLCPRNGTEVLKGWDPHRPDKYTELRPKGLAKIRNGVHTEIIYEVRKRCYCYVTNRKTEN